MATLRIGLIGAGKMGQCAHLRSFSILPECEVVALADLRPKLAEQVARRYGVPRVYASGEELLQREKLDGVVAIQPFQIHHRTVPALLDAGVPVMIEKPLATSIRGGEAIVEKSQRLGVPVMVGYHRRCDPATTWAIPRIRQFTQNNLLGALTCIRVSAGYGDWTGNGLFDLIRTDEPAPRHGESEYDPDLPPEQFRAWISFINYFSHHLNLARGLLGESYDIRYLDPGSRVMVGRSAGGVTVILEKFMTKLSRDWDETALIAFERGTIHIEYPPPLALNRPGRVVLYDGRDGAGQEPVKVEPVLPREHAMREQARAFLAVVRGEAPPPVDAAAALADLRTARQVFTLGTPAHPW